MDLLHEDILTDEQEFEISNDIGSYLIETSKWAKFIAITFFAATGIGILFFLFFGSRIWGTFSPFEYDRSGIISIMIIALVLALVIVGVTYYFLLDFANKMRIGIETESIDLVNGGLRSLKVHFIIIGILSLLGLLFSLFSLIK